MTDNQMVILIGIIVINLAIGSLITVKLIYPTFDGYPYIENFWKKLIIPEKICFILLTIWTFPSIIVVTIFGAFLMLLCRLVDNIE